MGRILSALQAASSESLPELNYQPSGSQSRSALNNPRLMRLATASLPTSSGGRDESMLLIAHALIWQAGCTLYGGFVRDWVIRGEPANDIDALIPSNRSPQQVQALLQQCAKQVGIQVTGLREKGIATTVTLQVPGAGNVEVDLVTLENKRKHAPPPGVDCTVGNLCVLPNGVLDKLNKNAAPTVSLAKCKSHCEKKKFVFLYDPQSNPGMCAARLRKYLSRGWVCLTTLPSSFLEQNGLTEFATLIKPKAKYSLKWWST
jgi:hypothetical protein